MTSDTLSIREAAEVLNVHYVTALRYARLGLLPGTYKLPGGATSPYRVDRKALERWKRGKA